MGLRVGVAVLLAGLLSTACGSTQPTQAPTGSQPPNSSQPASSSQPPTSSEAPTSGQQPSPIGTPASTQTATSSLEPGATGQPVGSLPEPQLQSADEIVAAMAQPEMAEQAVVSMLAALGIGLYHDDGTVIRQGLEQSDNDYYAFESEAMGLVEMLREAQDPGLLVTWQEYNDALVALGLPSTPQQLVDAYSSAYTNLPDEPITKLVLANAPIDVNAQITPLGIWLLWLDGFIPGSLSQQAVALAGGELIAAGPPAGHQNAGAAWRALQQAFQNALGTPQQQAESMRRLRMMSLIRTSTVSVDPEPSTVHEVHSGQTPTVSKITAEVRPCGGISPFTSQCTMPPNPVLSGINVTWRYPGGLTSHGNATVASGSTVPTDSSGQVSFTFTPQAEVANGQGVEKREPELIEATVSKLDVAQKVWQMQLPPKVAAAFLGKKDQAQHGAVLTVVWHEEPSVPVEIIWTDVYDGVPDTITFKGKLDKVDTANCLGENVTCLTGTGTAEGDRGGWKSCNPGIDQVPTGPSAATFNGVIIGDKITISAYADAFTGLSGVSTSPMEVDLSGGFVAIPGPTGPPTPRPSGAPVGELCPHYSYGSLTLTQIDAPL